MIFDKTKHFGVVRFKSTVSQKKKKNKLKNTCNPEKQFVKALTHFKKIVIKTLVLRIITMAMIYGVRSRYSRHFKQFYLN